MTDEAKTEDQPMGAFGCVVTVLTGIGLLATVILLFGATYYAGKNAAYQHVQEQLDKAGLP